MSSLPPKINETFSQALKSLIDDANKLLETMSGNNEVHIKGFYGGEGVQKTDMPDVGRSDFASLRTRCLGILNTLAFNSNYVINLIQEISALEHRISHLEKLMGMMKGFKELFDSGLLKNLAEMVEAEIASDYMGAS